MRLIAPLCLAVLTASAVAFQIPTQYQKIIHHYGSSSTTTQLFSTTSSLLSLDRSAQREIDQFQGWAGSCGVQPENGFCLQGQMMDGNEDYYAATATGAAEGSRVLYVPGEMILSAARIAQEYEGYIDAPLRVLGHLGLSHVSQQFHLFVKVLVEYESGEESPYRPWLEALPRKWNTAVSMDDFCLSVLPPYIKSLCAVERNQLECFRQALNSFEYLSAETKSNSELMKFAYNVVFTRSRPTDDGDYRIIPVADMINHDNDDNVVFSYDENGGCGVYAKQDVAPGSPLTLCYGHPQNPSRFLATYGFLNEAPAAFCKLLIPNPSQEVRNIGYDPTRMVFYNDGSVAQEVWDVLLYSRLERKPDQAEYKEAFYQACMSGDEETKGAIHAHYQKDTVAALIRHVDHILIEVHEMTVKMNAYDSSKHPRLPLLQKHHAMVTTLFSTVRDNLVAIQG